MTQSKQRSTVWRVVGCAFAFGLTRMAFAEVTVAPLFCDHAVLQQGMPVPVWGRAAPGEKVSVEFADQIVVATANQEGRWQANLAPLAASGVSQTMVIKGQNLLTLHDLVVGEVWLASGQSNMEVTVAQAQNPKEEIANANWPLLRQFKVQKAMGAEPMEMAQGAWQAALPDTVADFSAVGYFFGVKLMGDLRVPVGIVNSTWGGTPIEPWLSGTALAKDGPLRMINERWQRFLSTYPERKATFDRDFAAWKEHAREAEERHEAFALPSPVAPVGPGAPSTPSALFNGMISPLVPYALRGVIWYQGESNRGRPAEYAQLFPALIADWRRSFGQSDLPFFWVQLANFKASGAENLEYAYLRESQSRTLSVAGTGQALAIDIGEPDNIHPRNKQEVGRRLTLLAETQVYGMPGEWSGPVFERTSREGGKFRVRFRHATGGLRAKGGNPDGFEVAGADQIFVPAVATIDGDSVIVGAEKVPAPIALRYAFRNAPRATLYNGVGLPAVPFRTDDWQPSPEPKS